MMIRHRTLGYDAVRRLGFVSGLRLGPERFQQADTYRLTEPPHPANGDDKSCSTGLLAHYQLTDLSQEDHPHKADPVITSCISLAFARMPP